MKTKKDSRANARRLGAILQGLALGVLLSVALVEMWVEAEGVRIFRYQNF